MATTLRSILNGNGGTVEIGAQHRLVVYNSPALMTNELNSNTETCRYPRFNSLANVQPALFDSFLGPGTPLFNVGLTSRNAAIILTPNFDPSGRRPPMSVDEQTLVPFVLQLLLAD